MRLFLITFNLFLTISFFPFLVQAQSVSVLESKTSVTKGTYTLAEFLEKLNSNSSLSINYNSNELPLNEEILIENSYPSLEEALNIIVKQLPVQYQVKDSYIIIKTRRSESKYFVQGTVSDSETGETLIGVSIFIPKDFIGSVTDAHGRYSLKIPSGEYIVSVNYMGYARKQLTISVNSNKQLDIQLDPSKILIDEVNITSQKNFFGNMNLGRSISSIDMDEIKNLNVNNVADILHAREAGVWTTKASGAPGDHQRIRIRGIHSIYSGVDPLYVVDGVSIPNVNLSSLGVDEINIHDIRNITILKDISSSSVYGFQGGNGVVLIDTKQGNENSINFTTRFGMQRFDKFYSLMDTKEFMESLDAFSSIFGYPLNQYYPPYSDTLANTDWQKEIFNNAMLKEYLLSLSGSSGKFRYYISGGYFDQEGVLKESLYNKYTLLINISRTFKKRVFLGLNYRAGIQKNQNNLDTYMGNSQIIESITKSPSFRSTNSSYYRGGSNYHTFYPYLGVNGRTDTDSLFSLNSKHLNVLSHSVAVSLRVQLTENMYLDACSSLSLRENSFIARSYYSWSSYLSGYLSNKDIYLSENQKLQLNFAKRINSHEFNFIGGFRRLKDRAAWIIDSTDINFDPENSSNELFIRNSLALYGYHGDVTRRINTWVAHFNYTFRKKYSISIATNYDHLEEGKYLDSRLLFPSVALNWDVAKEPFLNKLVWLDHFNLYVNWGKAGNFPINTISDEQYIPVSYTYGNETGLGVTPAVHANQFIKPELIEEFNCGTRISLFNSRVNISTNLFSRTINNLIVQSQLSVLYGGGLAFLNIGEMKGTGKELGLEVIPILKSGFSWYSRFGLSQFSERVTKLNRDKELPFIDADILIPDLIIKEGGDLGNIFGYEYVGKATDEMSAEDANLYFNSNGLKYRKYDTVNAAVTANDRTIIGNSIPDYTLSWYNSLTMNKFTLDFLWYAVKGIQKYNATRAATYMGGNNRELIGILADSIAAFRFDLVYQSSYFVEDASFIRLKYITLNYHPTSLLWDKVDYSISLSFENLFTITGYKGYDPESTIYTGNSFTDNAIDRGAYPSPRSIHVGINLKF
jgi:TonB-linked SusC/RagA family outer membrane protein